MAKREGSLVALEAEDATISTATITIKTMQVGKKQMTQSVFRQLPEAQLVNEDEVRLFGLPWGWVNYHWGDIDSHSTHFVFQLGGKLFRSAFRIRFSDTLCGATRGPKPYLNLRCKWEKEAEALYLAAILEGWTPDRANESHERWNGRVRSEVFGDHYVEGMPSHITIMAPGATDKDIDRQKKEYEWRINNPSMYGNIRKRTPEEIESETRADYEKSIRGIRGMLSKRIVDSIGAIASTAEIRGRILQLECLGRDYFRRWDDLMKQLRGVEQLFIAA
jgi:hypothetical protein